MNLQCRALRNCSIILFLTLFSGFAWSASEPFAKGEAGALAWEVRFTHLNPMDQEPEPVCDVWGETFGAYCSGKKDEVRAAAEKAGIEDRIEEILFDEKYKTYAFASLSFSHAKIPKLICQAAEYRDDINVYVFVDSANFEENDINGEATGNAKLVKNCVPERVKLYGRGIGPFGSRGAHLQHMKIFLASPLPDLVELSELDGQLSGGEFEDLHWSRSIVTSSSANLSSNGTRLHFENWLFLEDYTDSYHIRANVCALKALMTAQGPKPRNKFVSSYKKCRESIDTEEREDLKFYAVPHGSTKRNKKNPEPFVGLKKMLDEAQSYVHVAIHRLTTSSIGNLFINAQEQGAQVDIVYDDDTLWANASNLPWSWKEKVRANFSDVKVENSFKGTGIGRKFMETNNSIVHLHHNKFIVVDGEVLFQGAGNFTGTALNIKRKGNYEQFYEIRIPGIVKAYDEAWSRLNELATWTKDHPAQARR